MNQTSKMAEADRRFVVRHEGVAPDFHVIGYEGLEVSNPVSLASILTFAAQGEVGLGAKVIDIGAGTGGVAAALAERFACEVHAIEAAPVMVHNMQDRFAGQPFQDRIHIVAEHSSVALKGLAPADMIVALGTTDAGGTGARRAADIFQALAPCLRPGGSLLWGDLTWTAQPPPDLLEIVSRSGVYASDLGWRQAAFEAGLDCKASAFSEQGLWDRFFEDVHRRVRDWLTAHPDVEGAAALRAQAEQVQEVMTAARPYLGFGLYLFKKTPEGLRRGLSPMMQATTVNGRKLHPAVGGRRALGRLK